MHTQIKLIPLTVTHSAILEAKTLHFKSIIPRTTGSSVAAQAGNDIFFKFKERRIDSQHKNGLSYNTLDIVVLYNIAEDK